MRRMHYLLMVPIVLGLVAGCSDMKKWRDTQVQKARGEYKEPTGPEQHAPPGQPLFRQKEFNAVEQDQDGPLVRADVMLVNGQTVRACDVLEPSWGRIEDLARTAKPSEYAERVQLEIRQRIRETISEFLVWHEVKKKLTTDMEDPLKKAVESKVRERINKHFEGSQAKFERYLSQRGMSMEDYKEQEKRRITTVQYLREEILPQIHISRRQLEESYRQNRKNYESPARVKIQMIDLPDNRFSEADLSDPAARIAAHDAAAAEARKALAELKAGADFAEVAKKYSRGIHAEEGGRWDWVNEDPGLQGRWQQPSKVAFGLKAGEYSDILEMSDGYFIVRAEEKVDATRKEFQDVQQELDKQLRDAMFDTLSGQYMMKLWSKGDIQGLTAFNARLLTLVPKVKPKASVQVVDASVGLEADKAPANEAEQ
jgi:parvulin-like peptidyl-prolyl isomerase